MPGIEDLLSPILGALGMGGSPSPVGGPPPPPNAGPQGAAGTPPPSASAAPAPSPDFMTGLEHGLSNPLLQGAIASYLGTIGSPRREGWSRALAHGGLEGLGAFNQAEQQKSKGPLEAAQLAAEQAKTPELQAATKLSQARTEKLAGDPVANAASADSLAVMAQNEPSPAKKAIYTTLAPAVRAGTIGMDKVMTLAMNEDLNGARVEAAKASTKKSEAETGLIPTKEKEINAHIGEMGTASSKNVAEAEKARNEVSTGGIKPRQVIAWDKNTGKETNLVLKPGESLPDNLTTVKPESTAAGRKENAANVAKATAMAEKDWTDAGSWAHVSGNRDEFMKEATARHMAELGGSLNTSTNKFSSGSAAASKSGRPMVKDPASPSGWSYAE